MASNPWLAGVNVSKCPVCDVRLLNGSCIDHGPPAAEEVEDWPEDLDEPTEPETQPGDPKPAEPEKPEDSKEPVEPEKQPEGLGEDDRSQFTDFQNYFLNIHTLSKGTSKQPEEKPEDKLEEKSEEKPEEKPEESQKKRRRTKTIADTDSEDTPASSSDKQTEPPPKGDEAAH